jgi:uncharacterized protein (UPF0333 family)
MKKAQISFEFIVLFAILFFVFISLAGFFPIGMDMVSSTKGLAENMANDIKVKAITASLSSSDFSTEIIIPSRINSAKFKINVYDSPDNLLTITDQRDHEQLARAFLPRIDSVIPASDPSLPVSKLIIRKDVATNNLSIEFIS